MWQQHSLPDFFHYFFIDYLLAIHYIRELRGFGAGPKVSYPGACACFLYQNILLG